MNFIGSQPAASEVFYVKLFGEDSLIPSNLKDSSMESLGFVSNTTVSVEWSWEETDDVS